MREYSRGFATILIVLFVLLLLGGAGYYVYQSDILTKTPNQQPSSTVPPTVSPNNTPTPTADPTDLWNTHSTSTYKIKYPQDIDFKEEDASVIVLSKWGPTQKPDTEFYDGILLRFEPRELPNETPASWAQSMITKINSDGIAEVLSGPDPISINGYQGVTFTEQGLGTFKNIILQSNNKIMLILIIDTTVDPGNLGFDNTVNEILNTFEFIE